MAAALVGGAFLSASLQVLFDRLASQKVIDLFKGRKLSIKLLNKLKRTMQSVEVVLDDAEEKQITRPSVRKWLDDLKDAFYEADDLLDEIAYAAMSSEMEAGPQNSIDRFLKFISSEEPLEEIHEKLQDLLDQKNALGLKEGTGVKLSSQKVPTTSLMDESVVYGRDEDKGVIIQLLLSDDANCNKLGLIPIVGMGGVGKTTLAQSVYNDSRVKERFLSKAWIYVSEEFDVLKITRSILNGVSKTKHDFNALSTEEDFQVALKNELTNKKFLLVLDDVWSDRHDQWEFLLKPLKTGAKGSKIIVTTRHQSVASVTTRLESEASFLKVQTHHLKKLSDEECWSLFSKLALHGRSSSASTILEKIGREIVRKCDGLPLAAKSLGGLLGTKEKPEEWRRVLTNNIWNLKEDNIIPALRLSYHFFPSPLKQCFAYCALFPKGYLFEKEELVLLWMGEGFLGQAGFSMEREVTGEEYFDDLVSRSFFNPDEGGFIMHDLINDLARYVAGEFFVRLDDDDDSCKFTLRTRHLYYSQRKSLPPNKSEAITSAPLLRTLLFGAYGIEVIYALMNALMKFERLRVLSLSCSRYELKLDDSIGNLKHLRYLKISNTLIRMLPESLCSLYHLEILLLRCCRNLVELPLNLGNLANLCVLDIEGTHLQKMPPQMGKLTKLQKLTYFMIGKESGTGIQELGNLRQLRGFLVIRNLQNVKDVREASSANIKGKTHLKELELVWKGDADDPQGDYDNPEHDKSLLEQLKPHENVETLTISGYGGIEFPNWNDGGSLLLGIVTLKLDGCRYCRRLPPLGQLVHLKQLVIRDFPNIVSIGPEFYGRCASIKKPFQSLEVLTFDKMPLWQEWETCGNEEEVFHLLQELYIIDCPAFIESLPQYLPSLIKLRFTKSERLVASLPTIPRILNMDLKDLELCNGRLKVTRSPLERIELLGGCGFFNTLQEVEIYRCDFLKCFPLESFSDLKHLHIGCCPIFETINGNCTSLISLEIDECLNFVSFPGVGLKTPNLQRLKLWNCSNLKWLPESLLYSLEELIICSCPKLESFLEGGLPVKLHRLVIVGCTELINGRNKRNFDCLPSLLYFKIGGYQHAECFPEESLLPPTLTSLEIVSFPNLKSLEYKGIQHLTSLQCLSISGCRVLQLLPEEGLPSSLTCLRVSFLDNLESLVNSKIQQLSNLKKLSIEYCPKLKSVPEEGLPSTITSLEIRLPNLESLNSKGLQNLTSLEELKIVDCPKLQSLPESQLPPTLTFLLKWDFPNLKSLEYEGFQHLTSLQRLFIGRCPELQLLPEEGLPSSLTSLCIWDLQNLGYVANRKIQQLTNLKQLWINKCPKLKSVPEERLPSTIFSVTIWDFADLELLNYKGLQNLTSLKRLSIRNCHKL
ncbi:hypothetical protein K2173_020079 [Erythroxylum novogranatense]|uniref:Disease resistance RPP13-like protein 1 n=1 Tax=Erythroxylum novogranatense TaxID=1862640 RepID=A0AAV8U717_9ROSI|nr:hypothetical protein K2173_020079 [Erythroxylum novogranatense]